MYGEWTWRQEEGDGVLSLYTGGGERGGGAQDRGSRPIRSIGRHGLFFLEIDMVTRDVTRCSKVW